MLLPSQSDIIMVKKTFTPRGFRKPAHRRLEFRYAQPAAKRGRQAALRSASLRSQRSA